MTGLDTPVSDSVFASFSRKGGKQMRRAAILSLMMLLVAGAALAVDVPIGDPEFVAFFELGQPQTVPTNVEVDDYSNITNFLGLGILQGPSANQAGNQITRLRADDLTPTGAHAGQQVFRLTFSVANFNTVPVSARARVRFWFDDGAGGTPGTYYNLPASVGFTFNLFAFQPGVTLLNGTLPANSFNMPGVRFWAGLTLDNGTGAGGTAAQMDNLGQGIFDPPTIGSSTDVLFLTNGAGSFFNTANPAGALQDLGTDPANVGWALSVDEPVPAVASSWGRIKKLYR